MSPIYALGLLSLTASVAVHANFADEQQRPTKTVPFHTEGGPSPAASLEDLWKRSDLVVEGAVIAPPRFVEIPAGGTLLTQYEFQVLQFFKQDSELGEHSAVITVQRPGGIIDRGSHMEDQTDLDLPRFHKGERYVLFLRRLPGKNKFTPPTADFVFLIDNNKVAPRGKGPLAREQAGRDIGRLATALRSLGGGK